MLHHFILYVIMTEVCLASSFSIMLDGGKSINISTKSELMKQVNNVDVLLFESAGACGIPVATNDLNYGLDYVLRFLFFNFDFNF